MQNNGQLYGSFKNIILIPTSFGEKLPCQVNVPKEYGAVKKRPTLTNYEGWCRILWYDISNKSVNVFAMDKDWRIQTFNDSWKVIKFFTTGNIYVTNFWTKPTKDVEHSEWPLLHCCFVLKGTLSNYGRGSIWRLSTLFYVILARTTASACKIDLRLPLIWWIFNFYFILCLYLTRQIDYF